MVARGADGPDGDTSPGEGRAGIVARAASPPSLTNFTRPLGYQQRRTPRDSEEAGDMAGDGDFDFVETDGGDAINVEVPSSGFGTVSGGAQQQQMDPQSEQYQHAPQRMEQHVQQDQQHQQPQQQQQHQQQHQQQQHQQQQQHHHSQPVAGMSHGAPEPKHTTNPQQQQQLPKSTQGEAPISSYTSRASGSLTPFQALLKGELGLKAEPHVGPSTGAPTGGNPPVAAPATQTAAPSPSQHSLPPVPPRGPVHSPPGGGLAGIPPGAVSLIPASVAGIPGASVANGANLVSPVSINLRAFNLFAARVRPEVRAQHPEYGGPETERAIGMRWNAMGPNEREEYLEMARKEREALVAQGLIDPNFRPRRKRRKRAEIEAEAMMKQASLGRWMRSAAAAAAAAAGGGGNPLAGATTWSGAGGLGNGEPGVGALGVILPGVMAGVGGEGDGSQGGGLNGMGGFKDGTGSGEAGGSRVTVGQGVHGVLDGSFDAGFFVTLRVTGSATVLRGVVFAPGSSIPVTSSNDIAPGVPRAEPDGLAVHTAFAAEMGAHGEPPAFMTSAVDPQSGGAPLPLPAPGSSMQQQQQVKPGQQMHMDQGRVHMADRPGEMVRSSFGSPPVMDDPSRQQAQESQQSQQQHIHSQVQYGMQDPNAQKVHQSMGMHHQHQKAPSMVPGMSAPVINYGPSSMDASMGRGGGGGVMIHHGLAPNQGMGGQVNVMGDHSGLPMPVGTAGALSSTMAVQHGHPGMQMA